MGPGRLPRNARSQGLPSYLARRERSAVGEDHLRHGPGGRAVTHVRPGHNVIKRLDLLHLSTIVK
jgi:hypothetical protein